MYVIPMPKVQDWWHIDMLLSALQALLEWIACFFNQ